jgi:hypothetical protein
VKPSQRFFFFFRKRVTPFKRKRSSGARYAQQRTPLHVVSAIRRERKTEGTGHDLEVAARTRDNGLFCLKLSPFFFFCVSAKCMAWLPFLDSGFLSSAFIAVAIVCTL